MKLGAVYPQTELNGDPDAVRAVGVAVEALGYDYLLAFDHVLGSALDREPKLTGPYTNVHPFHEPFVAFAYLAGITQRIELATGVLILPQRQTALVAKQAADLDLLSHERLRLGIGIGWNYVEYDALGQDFTTRSPRADEQIDLLRRLWAEPLVTFNGRFDQIDRAGILPRPKRSIPIWIGGMSDPAFRRSARLGDGHIFIGGYRAACGAWTRIERYLIEAGRDPKYFGRELIIGVPADDKTPKAMAEMVEKWKKAGGTHASIVTMGKGIKTVQAHIDYFAEVRKLIGSTVSN